MKASFLKPAKPGMLFAEAWNIHEGSKIYVSDVEAKNNRGELVTKSLVNYYLVQNE